jgi:hypothetical protein
VFLFGLGQWPFLISSIYLGGKLRNDEYVGDDRSIYNRTILTSDTIQDGTSNHLRPELDAQCDFTCGESQSQVRLLNTTTWSLATKFHIATNFATSTLLLRRPKRKMATNGRRQVTGRFSNSPLQFVRLLPCRSSIDNAAAFHLEPSMPMRVQPTLHKLFVFLLPPISLSAPFHTIPNLSLFLALLLP